MEEDEARKELEEEGFKTIYRIDDSPNKVYSEHTHDKLTAHIILDGQMQLKSEDGSTGVYTEGDRVDVEAGAVHKARMGAEGCSYLVGEK